MVWELLITAVFLRLTAVRNPARRYLTARLHVSYQLSGHFTVEDHTFLEFHVLACVCISMDIQNMMYQFEFLFQIESQAR